MTRKKSGIKLRLDIARKKYEHGEFVPNLSEDEVVVRLNWDDKRMVLRKECGGCMANYKYAKMYNKMVLYNIYTEDIIGVSMENSCKRNKLWETI